MKNAILDKLVLHCTRVNPFFVVFILSRDDNALRKHSGEIISNRKYSATVRSGNGLLYVPREAATSFKLSRDSVLRRSARLP